MKNLNLHALYWGLMGMLALIFGCQPEAIQAYAPTEKYPEDTILESIESKRAMIVVAHDDDMCATSGTVALLNQKGWEIAVVSMSKTQSRNEAQRKACMPIMDTVFFAQLSPEQIRNDLDSVEKAYEAFPKANFDQVFSRSLLEAEYSKYINAFQPTVIFTLDSSLGGYGHPEHVFVSQMVLDMAKTGKISPAYIYQSVFTDHMEESIMERHSKRMKSWGFPGDGWDKAKSIYGVEEGMPEPTVEIDIRKVAELKMNYLRSYNEKERSKIGFFLPAFEDYTPEEYFGVFNREFFHIVKI
ncbi:MAG: PIG-L family deacetylase [Vicingaceae bacterium]